MRVPRVGVKQTTWGPQLPEGKLRAPSGLLNFRGSSQQEPAGWARGRDAVQGGSQETKSAFSNTPAVGGITRAKGKVANRR